MNIQALLQNIQQTFVICPTLGDRLKRLLWLYGNNSLIKQFFSYHYQISFIFDKPINKLELLIRNNLGADNFIFSEVFLLQYYNFELPIRPQTILDLGANIGFTTIFFAHCYPDAQLVSVEPISNNVELLRKNLNLNLVKSRVISAAIAVLDGEIQMKICPKDYGHKIASIDYGNSFEGEVVDVKAISVPTILGQMNWNRVGLLKIDIEGYEAILLKESCDWLAKVDNICIECHEGYGESDLIDMAQQWGFLPPQKLPGIWLLTRAI